MAAPLSAQRFCKLLRRNCLVRFSSTDDSIEQDSRKKYLGSLDTSDKSASTDIKSLQSFEVFVSNEKDRLKTKLEDDAKIRAAKAVEENKESFASLFRKSKFVQMGDPHKRILTGKISDTVHNDVYIDFGGKFYCVCTPKLFPIGMFHSHFYPGKEVKIELKEFEMTSSFLGSDTHLTLLEADAVYVPSSTVA
ncbi:hypothetical protein FSP39_016965 [Pinctada imbricata]|uniref:Mitochondrial ribosomal protein S28 n=1 Tax=Pinctada imbricata TaxID=66713 RepID=A0AA88XT94_PINIB|nr:hypothetical protein FSP39_016965 [Pinctada imbricata]